MTETVSSSAQPGHAQVVVIGAGVVGASVAYHLAALGCRDVVLLERAKIGSGTSWHAAGNMETYRADPLIGEMIRYAVEFYPRLEAETGQALGWRQTGRVMFTTEPERLPVYRGLPALGRARGLDIEYLTPRQVVEKLPIASEKGIVGGVWIPSDGRINPTDLAVAFARGAKMRGVRIFEDTAVTGMTVKGGRIASVVTAAGEIACENVVIAAGLWSPVLGRMIGVKVPLHAVQHLYILTKPLDIVTRDMPLFLSYDERMYGREDVGGLLVGFFDRNAIPITPAELPRDFSFGLLDSNWNQVEANMTVALERFPVLHKAEIRTLLNGPESFTPDMQMLLGETPAVRGCFLATGMNSSGIALSAAAGKLTAEWIVEGRPSLDATRLENRRFADSQSVTAYARDRASEVVSHMCRRATAELDFDQARMIRRSPIHAGLAAAGARFITVVGWERPIWFEPPGQDASDSYDHVAREVAAAETGVALFDRSSDAKLRLEGPKAEALLRKLSGAIVDLAIGAVVAAPMLNPRGGVEALPTVVRLGSESFLLFAGAEQITRLTSWVDWHKPASGVTLVDVTSGFAALALQGPRAMALLQSLGGDLKPAAGRMLACELGYAPCLLLPGETGDGFYILVASEFAADLFERLTAAGAGFGLSPAGSLAQDALDIARGRPRFGIEATPQLSAVAAGLDAGLDPAGNRGFIGRGALLRQRKTRPPLALRAFTLDLTEPGVYANAPVLWKRRPAGHITGGAVIPSLGKAVVLALIKSFGEDIPYRGVVLGQELPLTPYAPPPR
ncbi:MAG TPA: FAD-dependent oxidoreductase [Verrucomicrobiae bacterium]|nr:FAD-dependent oxidoreductase [Verrucomicrobiae bacterium]